MGEFLNEKLLTKPCSQCNKGSYGDEIGKPTSCKICLPGTVQNLVGQSKCNVCADGYYQEKSEQTVCQKCARGKFSNYDTEEIHIKISGTMDLYIVTQCF